MSLATISRFLALAACGHPPLRVAVITVVVHLTRTTRPDVGVERLDHDALQSIHAVAQLRAFTSGVISFLLHSGPPSQPHTAARRARHTYAQTR